MFAKIPFFSTASPQSNVADRRAFVLLAKLFVTVALTVIVVGCAFQNALRQGDDYAAAGQWAEAVREYETAQSIDPDNETVREKLKTARHHAANAALTEAEDLHQQQQWRDALDKVAEADQFEPNTKRAAEIRTEIRGSLIERAEKFLGTGKLKVAYEAIGLANRRFPGDPDVDGTLRNVRQAVIAKGDEQVANKDFHQARLTYALIGRHEEHRNDELAGLLAHADREEAKHHRGLGAAAQKQNHLGTALVHFSIATRLAPEPGDPARLSDLRSRITDSRAWTVSLTVPNDARSNQLREQLVASLAKHPVVAVANRGGDARLQMGRSIVNCRSDAVERTGSHRYVSSTRWVDNQEWLRLEDQRLALDRDIVEVRRRIDDNYDRWSRLRQDLERVEDRQRRHREREVADLQRKVEATQRDADRLRSEIAQKDRRIDRLERERHKQLERKIAKLQQRLDKLERGAKKDRDELDRMRRQPHDNNDHNRDARRSEIERRIDRYEKDKKQLERDMREHRERDRRDRSPDLRRAHRERNKLAADLAEVERCLTDYRNKLTKAATGPTPHTAELNRLRDRADRLDGEIRHGRERLDNLEGRYNDIARSMDGVPRQIEEKVWSNYKFPITDWTRSCRLERKSILVAGTRRQDWRTDLPISTSDSAHRGHSPVGLNPDPLRFPRSDADLIAELEKREHAAIEHRILENARAHRAALVTRARAATGDEATDLWVAAFLLDAKRDRRDVARHLQARFQLNDPSVLTR